MQASCRITHGPLIDQVGAEITLADGAMLRLSASRIAEARERRMRIVFDSGGHIEARLLKPKTHTACPREQVYTKRSFFLPHEQSLILYFTTGSTLSNNAALENWV